MSLNITWFKVSFKSSKTCLWAAVNWLNVHLRGRGVADNNCKIIVCQLKYCTDC